MASFVAGSALCLLVWAVRTGAMKDDEAPKYRMLDDDERTGMDDGATEEP